MDIVCNKCGTPFNSADFQAGRWDMNGGTWTHTCSEEQLRDADINREVNDVSVEAESALEIENSIADAPENTVSRAVNKALQRQAEKPVNKSDRVTVDRQVRVVIPVNQDTANPEADIILVLQRKNQDEAVTFNVEGVTSFSVQLDDLFFGLKEIVSDLE